MVKQLKLEKICRDKSARTGNLCVANACRAGKAPCPPKPPPGEGGSGQGANVPAVYWNCEVSSRDELGEAYLKLCFRRAGRVQRIQLNSGRATLGATTTRNGALDPSLV